MKKLLLYLAAVLGISAMASAETVTYTFATEGYGMELLSGSVSTYNPDGTQLENGGVVITTIGNTRWWAASKGNEFRLYKESGFTVSAPGTITEISFEGNAASTLSADKGDYTSPTWTGSESEVTFKTNITKSNTPLSTITVTYTAGGGVVVTRPTFSPAAGQVMPGTEVTLSCNTEGAAIYYTVDGSEPTASSTAYADPIVINQDTTIKAVAELDGTLSDVAEAVYTVVPTLEDFSTINSMKSGDKFIMNATPVVVYTDVIPTNDGSKNQRYTYACYEGKYILIYDSNDQYAVPSAGETIAPGWMGTIDVYNNLVEVKIAEDLRNGGEGEMPEPMVIYSAEDIESVFTAENMNAWVEFDKIALAEDYPTLNDKGNVQACTGEAYGESVSLYPRFFKDNTPAGEYTIQGFISVYKETVQLNVSDITAYTGIENAIVDQNVAGVATYYNINGMEVRGQLQPGMYIMRQGNKATKVLVK